LHCKFQYCHKMLSVFLLTSSSVRWVYCDKTAEDRIMQFLLKCSPMSWLFGSQVRWRNWSFPRSGAQIGVGWFSIDFATLYLGRCEIELRWQLIINRKSCWLSTATTVDDLKWPWMSIYCFIVRVMRIVAKRLRLELCCFLCKIPLQLGYPHIKFYDEIRRESIRILSIISD